MTSSERRRVAATYRLQLHAGFTFDDVRAVLPYLADLGVTHFYLSPITTSAPRSTHGYDVVDPTRLDPEFGGVEAYGRLVAEQRRLGLGQVVDVVPNHMGVAPGSGNAAWEDVLRHGRASQHAHVFDIDWEPHDPALRDRVVLPVLGEPLEDLLAGGDVRVESGDGAWVQLGGLRVPLDPASVEVWRAAGARDDAEALRALLDRQHYRLEFWRTAHESLNYRRFFTIDALAGVHAEDPRVFDYTHGLVLSLVRDGSIDGVRIDHPDGLRDPEAYLERLRAALEEAGAPAAYLVIEKILAADETLPEAWDCDGTTGYDFMNELTRVLTATQHEAAFTSIYERATGDHEAYEEIAERSRVEVVDGPLRAQVEALARRIHASEAAADASMDAVDVETFAAAMRALLARFPEYRTYHREPALDPRAPALVDEALERARVAGGIDASVLERAAAVLRAPREGGTRTAVLRLQQIMPAVQAKGLEDRAFYRYRRLLALNEVGGDPGTFGEPVEVFHARLADRARTHPRRMLSSATHDHKHGEDVRARLIALSEMPEAWADALARADAVLDARGGGHAERIAGSDRYLILQTLLGCAPAGMAHAREGDDDLSGRMRDYMRKALREAAERTDWVDGDPAYEDAVDALVEAALASGGGALLHALEPVLGRVAHLGAIVSLAQMVLKNAAPGVPDVYQGNEGWDLSLVDPDNRRAVDFAQRARVLDALRPALNASDDARRAMLPGLLAHWRGGAIKAYVLARGLRVRRDRAALFLEGTYEPLAVAGDLAQHVVAFARRAGEHVAIAVVPRLPGALLADDAPSEAFWRPQWGDTALRLPADLETTPWRDAYSGAPLEAGATLPLARVLGELPVALLLGEA